MNRKLRHLTAHLYPPPRWRTLLAGAVLVIGFVLWLALIADPAGTLHAPGVGGTLWMLLVIAIACMLAYRDRQASRQRK